MQGLLAEKVRNRKDKKGFVTPEQRWLTIDYKKQFIEYFDDNIGYAQKIINAEEARNHIKKMQEGKIPFDYSYWRIILFSVWMKVFNVEVD